MHIRKTFAGLCASLLAVTLLGLGLNWSAWHVISQPDYIKKTLSQSGIYDTIVQNVLQQKESDLAAAAGLPAGQPEVQGIVSQAVSPQLVQSQTEKVIDDSFAWLQGTSNNPNTSFDFSSTQQKIADGVASYTTQHLQSLPACTTAAAATEAANNPLQASCLPPGTDIGAIASQAKQKVLSQGNFADNAKIGLNEVATPGGSNLAEQLQTGPQLYQKIGLSLYVQAASAALFAAGLVVLSRGWRVGMRRVGIIALWTGAVSALMALLSSYGIHWVVKKVAQNASGSQQVQHKVLTIAQTVIDDVRNLWLYYGVALIAAGVVLLVVYRLARPSPAAVAASLAKEEGVDVGTPVLAAAANTPPAQKTASGTAPGIRPAPPKKPRKIQ